MENNGSKGVILITGGSGLIGRRLTGMLKESGYEVRILSRKKVLVPGARIFNWDYPAGKISEQALEGVDHIIHLAGASIADGRWTGERKREIIESRTFGARFLFNELSARGIRLKSFTSASATGYYGAITSDKIFQEDEPPGVDFAAVTCIKWENEAVNFKRIADRVIIIRTGIVLSPSGGMLGAIIPTVRIGISPLPGTGKQWVPWIDIDDLTSIYLKAVGDTSMKGIYNAVSPEPVTYSTLVGSLAYISGRRVLKPTTPGFILEFILGERSAIFLTGSRVSPAKIINEGFSFRYPSLESSLRNLLPGESGAK